ncbi:MAG: glycosyltransferase [Gemmatimonadetes bacterium]|nr:glycosyltransferase [Gemmatimonadota bacterium]
MPDATPANPQPLHVVVLCAPASVGGLEKVVQALAGELATSGHAVTVVAVVAAAERADPLFAPLRGTHVRCIARVFGAREYRRERREVQALLRELGADVLHTHGYRSDLLHGGPTRRAGIATVSTVHGSSRMGGLSHLFEWLQLRALRAADAVIAVSAPLARSLRGVGVPEERLHLLPNAVTRREQRATRAEARAALALPDDGTPTLGWVGRLVPVKGADVFLESLAGLPGAWRATLVGDGPERTALEAQATRLGIAERVRFAGAVPDAARFLVGLDAFVLSSRSEGTPIALLEAMQAGVPSVATAVGGVPDLLGDAGWLVPPESPAELRAAIAAMLASPAEAARRGAEARARVEREYDPRRWAARHAEIYRAAIARRASAGPRA